MNKKIRDTPELNVPSGYEFGDIYETEDTGYGYDKPLAVRDTTSRYSVKPKTPQSGKPTNGSGKGGK